jgi:hypothetical protein
MGAAGTFEFSDPKALPVPKEHGEEHGIYPVLGEQFLALSECHSVPFRSRVNGFDYFV